MAGEELSAVPRGERARPDDFDTVGGRFPLPALVALCRYCDNGLGCRETLASCKGYLIGYALGMDSGNLLTQAREAAGLSQAELSDLASTSRPTLSAYEHGRKSPTLATATRIVAAAGFDLTSAPRITFRQITGARGRPIQVPDALAAEVQLPLHLYWPDRGRKFDLRDRRQRARVYVIVLREGGPGDILTYIDGVLLIDLWDDLVLPLDTRAAWDAVVAGRAVEQVA